MMLIQFILMCHSDTEVMIRHIKHIEGIKFIQTKILNLHDAKNA